MFASLSVMTKWCEQPLIFASLGDCRWGRPNSNALSFWIRTQMQLQKKCTGTKELICTCNSTRFFQTFSQFYGLCLRMRLATICTAHRLMGCAWTDHTCSVCEIAGSCPGIESVFYGVKYIRACQHAQAGRPFQKRTEVKENTRNQNTSVCFASAFLTWMQ